MKKHFTALLTVLFASALSSCAWLGLSSEESTPVKTVAAMKKEAEEYGGDVFHDEEAFSTRQDVACSITGKGSNVFHKNFSFHFDLEQLHSSNWTERVSVGNGLEVYVNLWSFREYTLGLRNTRSIASDSETRLAETKGVWSRGQEKTITDLAKIRFQAKLFYSAEGQSYEIICPGTF